MPAQVQAEYTVEKHDWLFAIKEERLGGRAVGDNHKDEAILHRLQLPSSLASRCPVLFGVDVSYLLPMNFRQMNRWPAPCGAFLALQADILVDISLRQGWTRWLPVCGGPQVQVLVAGFNNRQVALLPSRKPSSPLTDTVTRRHILCSKILKSKVSVNMQFKVHLRINGGFGFFVLLIGTGVKKAPH